MADRYWVGGSGTWNSTDTTHWSTTNGGSGGASAPTSVDNVFFNEHSNEPDDTAFTVTIGTTTQAICCDFNAYFIGSTQISFYGGGSSFGISVYGNLNFSGGTSQISYN
jgi:hypothetical protein